MSVRVIDIAGIYLSEQGRLRRLVNRVVGNASAAEDLVQQTFVKLITAVERGHLENIPGYLTSSARNLALNHIRDVQRRGESNVSEAQLYSIPDLTPSPEATAIFRCELRRVLTAVASLPPRRREALVLHKFEVMSYDEIAAHQGVSRNTVITHIVIALADLDRMMERK